jgi:hypothetical protein
MSWGTPTLLRSLTGTTASTAQSVTNVTAAAGTLVIATMAFLASANTVTGATVTDSAGNTWVIRQKVDASAPGVLVFAWSILTTPLSSGSITFTRAGTGNITRWAGAIYSLSGSAPSNPEDTGVLAAATGGSASPAVTGNSGSQSNDFIFALDANWPTSTTSYTEDTADGWTNLLNNLKPSNTTVGLSIAYQVNSGTSGILHAPSLSQSALWAEMQVAFLPAPTTIAISGIGTALSQCHAAGAYAVGLKACGAGAMKGPSLPAFGAALTARTVAGAKGVSAVARFNLNLAARSAMAVSGRTAVGFAVALKGKTALAFTGRTSPFLATRMAARLFAALKGELRFGSPIVPFDPDYALLAPPMQEAMLTPVRNETLLAKPISESFLAE